MPKKDLLQISLEHLKASQKERRRYQVNVLGKEFVVLPDVFSPKYFVDTEFFARHVPIKKDGSFLEIGNGTGVVSIFALLRGARIVVSTDINPQAVKNTKINAKLHGVEKKIVILEGDLFDPVNGMRFDQIFWNPPFMNMTKN